MLLDENTGSVISQEAAEKLIVAFDKKFSGEVISSYIGVNSINAILAQEGCIGVRIYNGYDVDKQKISLVLVGVDANEKELLGKGLIYDELLTCPPNCPVDGLFVKK